jgi:hypothetical protein
MSNPDLSGFTASQLEEMAADDLEDARNASRRGDTGQRRELDASAAELRAAAGQRRK